MTDLAFLLTNRYQVHHYAPIARALPWPTRLIVEVRDRDFGVDREFVTGFFGDVDVRFVDKQDLKDLDGTADVIVCQTPVLPQVGLAKTLVVAQQYSLAKERYQYGVWRTFADLNLMYGPHSVRCVEGFCHAVAVGNPLFDDIDRSVPAEGETEREILFLPTYGSLGSIERMADALGDDERITVKLHHMATDEERRAVPASWRIDDSDLSPVQLIMRSGAVISDFSGAAFDTAYARRPLVLVDDLPDDTPDLERLSDADRRREALGPLAARFDPNRPLEHALEDAMRRTQDDESYGRFVARYFVDEGRAADACAHAIQELVERGPERRFDWSQVRDRNRSLMRRNRELNDEIRRLRRANSRLRTAPTRKLATITERAARRGRVMASRHPGVERRMVRLKHRVTGGDSTSPPASGSGTAFAPPWQRRTEIAQIVTAAAARAATRVGLCEVDGRPVFAVDITGRDRLIDALREGGRTANDLVVTARGRTVELGAVRPHDVALSNDFAIRPPLDHEGPGVTVHVVARQADGCVRSVDARAPVVDWTAEFSDAASLDDPRKVSTGFDGDIDVVYTWVDAADPSWRDRRDAVTPAVGRTLLSAANDERFIDRDELRFSLRSLWAFAPFVRRIHIVTDQQVPRWLTDADDRLTVVDHREIFPDPSVLPTFNSHAIEACLHRIPGLADHFLYFNDDFFLGREITPGDAFTRAGLPRARFAPSQPIPTAEPPDTAIPTDWAAHNAIRLVHRDLGMSFDRKHQHVPYALDRRLLEELEARYPAEFDATRRARFRSRSDLAVPSMFAHFAGVATGRAVEWATEPGDYVYADTGRADVDERFGLIADGRPKFFCLNATLHSAIPIDEQALRIRRLLRELYPSASPFEKGTDQR